MLIFSKNVLAFVNIFHTQCLNCANVRKHLQ